METEDTRKRELRALTKAMTELNLKEALVVTHDGEGEIRVNGGTVRLVPAWPRASPQNQDHESAGRGLH